MMCCLLVITVTGIVFFFGVGGVCFSELSIKLSFHVLH